MCNLRMKINAALATMLMLVANPAASKKYVYVSYAVSDDYHAGKDSVTVDTDLKFIYADHGSQKIKLCEEKVELYCFYGTSINFSVPKKHLSVGSSWNNGQRKFQAIRVEIIELLGQKISVYVISSRVADDRIDYFYYSERRGLLGVKYAYAKEDSTRFLLLTQKKGFPK